MNEEQRDNDIDRAKEELKKRYKQSDYEELIEFAAKYFVSDSRRRIEMDNFHQAMLNFEFAMADDNKEAQKSIEISFKRNTLFQEVMRSKLLKGSFNSHKMNNSKHRNNREAKKLVQNWWANDKNNVSSKAEVVNGYRLKLRDHNIYPSSEKDLYDDEVIIDWLANL